MNAPAITRLCCTFVVFGSVFLLSSPGVAQSVKSDALIIFGRGGMSSWDQNFNQFFQNALDPQLSPYFTPEFLSLIDASSEDSELIAQSLALKYSNREIGLVVAVLPEANSFVQRWRNVFAPGAEVIYVLPSGEIYTDNDKIPENEHILATAIGVAIERTLALIPTLLPNLQRLYVVGGSAVGDESYLARYRAAIVDAGIDAEIHYRVGIPISELIVELSQHSNDSAVLMSTYNRDNNGDSHRTILVAEQLSNSLDIPVFVNIDTLTAVGALGGSVTSSAAYARSAVDMAMDIVTERVSSQVVSGDTDYIFSGEKLDEFGINRSLLPANTIIVNEVPNLWRDYSLVIFTGIAVIVVQLFTIGLLLESRRRRIHAEEQLEQIHKMEALGTLAGGIAHDFNNILMSIVANTDLARLEVGEREGVAGRLDKISTASERAKNLVAQILMFSRQSKKRVSENLEIATMLEDSVDQLRTFLPATCKIEIHCENPLYLVSADATQLHQVVTNLCVNAQHAMDNHGSIVIHASNVHVDAPKQFMGQEIPEGDYVCVRFSDTGTGISEESLHHVFEPFYTTKEQGKGTGLGLALVYQIVKNHKGYIDIETSSSGTTVSFYLPAYKKPLQQMTQPVGTLEKGSELLQGDNQRILVVDDDEMVLDANRRALMALGYRVKSFSSSTEALEYFRNHSVDFDLIFTDLTMPEMDGIRLITSVRKDRPDIRAILCTGYFNTALTPETRDVVILKKPSSISEISAALHQALA